MSNRPSYFTSLVLISYVGVSILTSSVLWTAAAYGQTAPPDKVSGEILFHQQIKKLPAGRLLADHQKLVREMGANPGNLTSEDCALYTDHKLTDQEIADLAVQGITVTPDLWIPPVPGRHTTGFHLANVSFASLDFIRADARFVRLETTEVANYPKNDLGKVMINADDVLAGTGVTARNGTGIKIAVADSGIDLTHADFPTPFDAYDMTDGTSTANWGTIVANTVSPHGTHVAGTALGRGTLSGGKYKGSAPNATLCFYKIGDDVTGSASTTDEIEALNRALTVGAKVFTMSYGGISTYLDGSEPMEQAIDSATTSGMTVFISAGNDAAAATHDSVSVAPGATSATFGFTVTNPSSSSAYTTALSFRVIWRDGSAGDANMALNCTNLGGGESISQAFSGFSSRSTEAKRYTLTPNIAASGSKTYTLTLQNTAASGTTPLVHVYRLSSLGTFTSPDPSYTIGSPAVADTAIAVGAWTQRQSWTNYQGSSFSFNGSVAIGNLAPFSSLGPRVDGVTKPDIVAPGTATISARDSVGSLAATAALMIDNDGLNQNGSGPANYYVMQGTSMACPMAAGTAALMLENNPTLTPALVRQAYITTASNSGSPNNSVGYGLIDILAAIIATPLSASPVLAAIEGTSLSYTENQAATAVTSTLTVSDGDSANLTGGSVSITSGFSSGQDVLAMSPNPQNGITATYTAGTGVLSLTGTASVANYQAALRSVTYANSSDAPSTSTRTLTFVASDGTGSGSTTRNIAITAVNDIPVVTLPGATLNYTENAAATVIDATATVSDLDSADFNTGALTVDFTANGAAEDRLAIVNQGTGAGQIGVSGANVTFGGVTIGTFAGGTNGSTPLVITFNSATATPAAAQALTRNITYQNVSDAPSTLARTVRFVLTDGDGGTSSAVTETINVAAVNDIPVVTLPGAAINYTENAAATVIDATATVSDLDSADFNTGVLNVSLFANGAAEDRLAIFNQGTGAGQIGVSGSNVTFGGTTIGSFTGGDAVASPLIVTFNVNGTPAAAQALARNITYQNVSDTPSTLTRSIRFVLTDGDGGVSSPVLKSIAVAAVNDIPVVTLPGAAINYTENAAATVIDATATVSDLDSADFNTGVLNVSLFANGAAEDRLAIFNQGTGAGQIGVSGSNVTFGGTTIGSFTGGDAVASPLIVTFNVNGTPAAAQALARNITYQNVSDAPSTLARTVRFVLTDGDGGVSSPVMKSVNVSAVNDVPVVTLPGAAINYTENAAATVLDATATVSDVDSADFNTGVLNVSLFANGAAEDRLAIFNQGTGAGQIGVSGSNVTFGGTTIGSFTGGDAVASPLIVTFNVNGTPAAAQALARNITYQNVSDTPSTLTRSIRFVLTDGDGGVGSPAMKSVAVAAVNDVPVVTLPGSAINYTENAVATVIDATATVSDLDSTDFNTGTLTVDFTANGAAEDRLAIVNQGTGAGQIGVSGANVTFGGVTMGTFAGGTNGSTPLVITFNSATATPAAAQALTRNITYQNVSDTPSTLARTVRFVVTDGDGGTSSAVTETINVSAVNDAPVVAVAGTAFSYTESDPATIIDATGTVSDVDSADFNTGTLTVDFSANGAAEDRLAVRNQGTGAGQIGVSGANVTFGGVTIGTFAGGTSGSTPLVITFNSATATPSAAQALVRNITYQNVSLDPSIATRTVRFVMTDGDGGTSTAATRNIQVISVSTPPSLALPGAAVSYTENDAPTVIDGTGTVSDVDSADFNTGTLTVDFTANGAAEDRLAVRNQGTSAGQIGVSGANVSFGGVTIGTFAGGTNGSTPLVITFNSATATPAAAQALVRNVTYQNVSDNPSTLARTVRFVLTDGDGGTSTPGTETINITATNDAPLAALPGAAVTYTENDPATLLDATATVSDPDSADFNTGTLTVDFTANGAAEDRLSIRNQGIAAGEIGISGANVTFGGVTIGTFAGGSDGSTPLVITLNSATASPSAIQALARNLAYQNVSDAPSTLARTVRLVVSDGDGGTSSAVTKVININAVNDIPVLTMPGGPVAYTENDSPTIVDAAGTVSDPDSPDFNTGTLTVDFTANGAAEDRLAIFNQGTGAGQIGVSGANVTFGGVIIGTFAGGTSGSTPLVITFNSATATSAAAQALARNITYQNVSDNPSTLARTLRFVITDGDSGTSSAVTESINIAAVNDIPVVTLPGAAINYVENAAATVLDATATVSDVDSAEFNTGTFTINFTANGATEDRLAIVNQGTGAGQIGVSGANVSFGGVTIGTFAGGTSGSTPLVITFNSATATPAATQALARNITYQNVSDNPSGLSRTVRMLLTDGDGGTSTAVTKTVNVIPVNDAPTLTAISNPAAILEDAIAQTINLVGISTGGGETQTLTVTATSDNTGLIPNPTVTYTSANATGSLNYTPVANASGSATITVTVQDDGGTANGGVNQVVRTFTVNVTPVNDAPTLTAISNPAAILEDAIAQTINLAGISTGGGETQTLTVTATSDNTGLIPNPTVTYTSANATGSLNYTPVANASGSATITVTVQDDGGTANGGINQVVRTFTVNVTPVNDAPTLTAISNPAAILEDAIAQTINLAGISTGGGETQTLTVTASSDNTGLIPNPTVTYTSANATGSLSYTPVANANGTAVITVTVQDDGGTANGGINQVVRTFTVNVTPVNDAPTLTAISNPAAILEDAIAQTINLAGISTGGGETQTLTVTATSDNTGLIPNPTVTYTSANATGSLSYTPVADANGTAVITVIVQDNGGTANGGVNQVVRTFTVNVTPVNDVPTITAIGNPAPIAEDAPQQTVNLTGIGAGPNETQVLTLTAVSDNTALIPNPTVVYTSANATGALNYTPVPNANGTAVITVTLQDDGGTANGGVNQIIRTFTVSVTSVNDAPTLASIPNPAAILEDAAVQTVNLSGITAGADEVQTLTISAVSDNASIIPNPAVTYTSANTTGSLSYTPVSNAYGTVTITVTIQDDGGTANGGVNQQVRTFTVEVTPVNDQPMITAIPDPAPIIQDDPQQTIAMNGISAGPNETQVITIQATSSNPGLIPNPTVTYTSAGTSGTLSYTPVPGASGTATITVTVHDDGGTSDGGVDQITDTFTVVVYAPVVITTPPAPLTLNPGAPARFSVAATGTAPLTFLWRKNGNPIPTATNDFYEIPSVTESDQATYDVIVTNVVGPKTSDPALLSVNDPVQITSEPLALTLNEGEQADFAVAATGTSPITFQWRKDGVAMPLAQAAMFSIVSAQVSDEGLYDVVVSNIVGPQNSQAVKLTVLRGKPRIIRQPASQTVGLDTSVTFSVKAGGSAPFTYQWRKNGKSIVGAINASFNLPSVVATDAAAYSVLVKNSQGSIVSDSAQLTVNKAAAYNFGTLAGKAVLMGSADGTGDAARFSQPDQGARDSLGNLFIADRNNHTLRKVTAAGVVTLFAGSPGSVGTQDGTGTGARFSSPSGLAIDSADNLFVADAGSHLIRKVTPAGVVTTFAGTANVPGAADAIGTSASFRSPWGIAVDSTFNVFVADSGNHLIRKILPDGTVSTLAGLALQAGTTDALGTLARFNKPAGLAIDSSGILYVADELNHAIRRIAADGSVTTLAGLKGTLGSTDAIGVLARFRAPDGVGVDSGGNVFVADTGNHTIRLITPAGRVTTIGGVAGSPGSTNGLGSAARFRTARGVVIESQSSIYVVDTLNHTIRKGSSIALPQIDVPPQSLLVGLGQPASFTVTASGGAPLTFQWTKNGKNIAGANASTFTLPSTKLTDAGTFRVVVKNSAGALTSIGARLGVVSQASSQVIVNETAATSLTASAAGDNLIYEWQKNGKPLPPAVNLTGITTSKLTISKATVADAGVYACSVRLGSLRLETGNFTVSVRVKPVLNPFLHDDWTVSGTVTDALTVVDNSVLNAPTSYSVAGLPAGMTFNTKTGQLGGKPNTAGTYTLTITATNAAGRSTAQIVIITVAPVPANATGTFNGLVERDTQLSAPIATPPNQKLQGFGGSLNVVAGIVGTFTATLTLEGKAYIVNSRMDAHGPAGNPTATVIIKRGTGIPNLTLGLVFNAATGELNGTLTDGLIAPAVNVRAFRNPWLVSSKPALHNPATSRAGIYTAALTIADPALQGDPSVPQGRGYGTLTVSTNGAASWSGVLADGTVVTRSTTMGPGGEIPLHWMLYTSTGSAQGWIQASPGANAAIPNDNLLDTMLDLTQTDPEDQPLFDWFKKPQLPTSTTVSYKSGFPLHKLVIAGGVYVKPDPGQIILGLPPTAANSKITFSGGGVESALTYLNAGNGGPAASMAGKIFQITSLSNIVLPTGLAANPAAISFTIDPGNGKIVGSFTLINDPDPTDLVAPITTVPRKVTFGGLIVPRLGIGVGNFQLPELPSLGPPKTTVTTSPRWSGQVLIQNNP